MTHESNHPPLSQRIPWVDVAKGLGMLLVFHGHLVERFMQLEVPGAREQMRWIYAFHMPLFFFLAGYVHKDRDLSLDDFVKRLVRTRLVPAWIFNFLSAPLWVVSDYLHGRHGAGGLHGWLPLAQEYALRFGRETLQGRPSLNVLTWFLICLGLVELWQFGLRKLVRRGLALALSILGFGGLLVLLTTYSEFIAELWGDRVHWWQLTSAVAAMMFYQLGLLARRGGLLERGRSPLWPALLATASLGLTLLTFNRNPRAGNYVAVAAGHYGDAHWFLITALAGTLLVVGAAHLLSGSRFLSRVGQLSLGLMCLDGILHEFVNPPLARWAVGWNLPGGAWGCAGVAVLGTLVTLLACLPVAWTLKTYAPLLVGAPRGPRSD